MKNDIRHIIESMDVRADRDDAETKAISICKLGEHSLELLIDYARTVRTGTKDADEKRRLLRAVIFTLTIFATRLGSGAKERFRETGAIVLLFVWLIIVLTFIFGMM